MQQQNIYKVGIVYLVYLIPVMIYYHVLPTWNMLYLPLFILMMMVVPAAFGMWLSALAIRYRDVKFAMQFVIRLLIYTAPILYSASSIPQEYRLVYSLNPIVGVIEGYRACLLGLPMPWEYIIPGMFTAIILLTLGAFYFKRMEHVFVDVI